VSGRLSRFHPAVADALDRLTPDRQQAVAGALADLALTETGVSVPTVSAEEIERLVERFDAMPPGTWTVDGRAVTSQAMAAAASAVYWVVRQPAEPADAVFEAIQAIGDESRILGIVRAG
jgi:hypothetical protein